MQSKNIKLPLQVETAHYLNNMTAPYFGFHESSILLDSFFFCIKIWQKEINNCRMSNHTETTVFILLGLSDDPKLQVVIFIFLFITYTFSITGNMTIITLTLVDSHLQTPMYFFLRNFSVLEVSFTTVTIPKFLGTMISWDKTISFNNCIAQLFFSSFWELLNFTF